MKTKGSFIVTCDKGTIQALKEAGFQCLSEHNDTATFLNNQTIQFNRKGLHFAYTDIMVF